MYLWWFSVGICKYKPGYKFEYSHWLKLQHSDWRANLVKDFFKDKFFTNESTRIIITGQAGSPGLYLQIPTENHL